LILKKIPTVTVFNDDDGLINSIYHSENMTASDTANLKLKVVYDSKGGWSPYGKTHICVKLNSTLFDTTEVTLGASSGATTPVKENTPNVVSDAGRKYGAETSFQVMCWNVPGVQGDTVTTEEYTLSLKTTTKSPPKKTYDRKGGNINISIWDEDWFKNTESGAMELGIADDTDVDVGAKEFGNATILVSG
jgi:hypothetical protein